MQPPGTLRLRLPDGGKALGGLLTQNAVINDRGAVQNAPQSRHLRVDLRDQTAHLFRIPNVGGDGAHLSAVPAQFFKHGLFAGTAAPRGQHQVPSTARQKMAGKDDTQTAGTARNQVGPFGRDLRWRRNRSRGKPIKPQHITAALTPGHLRFRRS